MDIELEPEVEEWLDTMRPAAFASVAFNLDRIVLLTTYRKQRMNERSKVERARSAI